MDIQNNIGLDILNSLNDYIAVLNEKGIIIYTNKAWDGFYEKNKTGLTNQQSGIGVDYLELCLKASKTNEEALKTYEGINLVIRGEASCFASSYLLDGNKWFTVSVEPLAGGRVMVTHKNVTGQVITDEEIVMDKVKFQYLFYEANIGMVLLDDSFHFIQVNDSFCDFIGYTENELRKLTPLDITVSDDIDETKVMMNYMTQKKENNKKLEKRYRRKDGRIVWGETSNRLIKSASDKILHYATIVDITARKKHELEIAEYEKYFSVSQDLICIANVDGYFVKINPRFTEVLGYSEEELLSQPFTSFIHEDDLESTFKEVENLAKGEKTIQFTNRYRCKNGVYKHFMWSSTPDIRTGLLYSSARDITDLINVKEERSQYFEILNNSLNEMYIIDAETYRFIDANIGAQKNIGYTLEELKEYTPLELKPDITQEEFNKIITPLVNGKENRVTFETNHLRKDGTTYMAFINLQYRKLGVKNVFVASVLDITERICHEKELKEAKENLVNIVDYANVGIAYANENAKLLSVNPMFADLLEYNSPEELIGKTISDFTHPEDLEKDYNLLKEIKDGERDTFQIEKRYVTKKLNIKWVNLHVSAVRDNNNQVVNFIALVSDITGNKKAEKDLIESESRLKLATESANIGIWDWDVKENILIWDDSMYKLFDVEKSSFSGAFEAWQKTLFPDDFDAANKAVESALKGERDFNTTFRITSKDGAIKHIHARGDVQFDENKEAIRMTGINMDVTNKVLVEQEKHNAIIKTEETERLRISHDLHDGLGQTIAAANMCFNALSDYAKDQLDEEALSMFNTGKELINEATKETRIVSHNIMPRSLNQFGLERAIDEMVSNYKKITESTNIVFNSNIRELRFNKDIELTLFRVIQESLSNALKHSKAKSIFVSLIFENEKLDINISDNGIGFNLDAVQEANIGIGLVSLSQRIDMIGGRLNIQTEPAEGTRINIAVAVV